MAENKFNLPAWAITLLLAALGVASVWGKVNADVGNINRRLENYGSLVESVSKLSAEVPGLSRRVDDIYTSQMEMQRDIKQLLRNTRNE